MVADVKQTRAFLNARLLQAWLNRVGPVLGLLLVIAVFSLLMDSPARFLSPNNLRIVLSQTVIVAIGAIGMTLIIISGGIDLAVGSTIALAGVVTALAINAGFSPTTALAAGSAVGGVVGVVVCFNLGAGGAAEGLVAAFFRAARGRPGARPYGDGDSASAIVSQLIAAT